ncbi:MAG: DMT family transporter [Thermodesulfovibrionales bacterium]|nr:DMT family transporter [Thermodesulfovibrionales bacterium]
MENIWILYALVCAFSLATSDALTKKALKIYNEYLIAWLRLVFSLPVLLIALILVPTPEIKDGFFHIILVSLPLEIIALILYIKALKISPLSVTLPFLSLTPIFLILISYVLIGEKVSFIGASGIILIVTGSYVLNISQFKKGIFEPFLAIVREKGSVYMILVALIYSITASLGKLGIERSSPIFFGSIYFLLIVIVFTPITYFKGKESLSELNREVLKSALLPGIFYALMIISHFIALSLTKVAYMISVKRLSLLIGVFYGYYLFKEAKIGEKFIGSVLMLTGFVLIVLSK